MGIYLFKTAVLLELLETTDYDDFGKHVIPQAIGDYRVYGYDFDDYWEDIGTIRSFYETNLALTSAGHLSIFMIPTARSIPTAGSYPARLLKTATWKKYCWLKAV